MRVLGISCSPRKGGNTEILIRKALSGARKAGADDTEFLSLRGKKMSPCEACGACLETGNCRIEDDMQAIYPRLIQADGIIIGTPVYFWTVSAQAKILIDRTYCIIRGKKGNLLRGKIGAGIVVARRAGGTSALDVLNNYLTFNARLTCVGGGIAYGYNAGTVRRDDRGMAEAMAVGRAVVMGIKCSAASEGLVEYTRTPMPSKQKITSIE
jgi:multimeric flavodoxin WrbA